MTEDSVPARRVVAKVKEHLQQGSARRKLSAIAGDNDSDEVVRLLCEAATLHGRPSKIETFMEEVGRPVVSTQRKAPAKIRRFADYIDRLIDSNLDLKSNDFMTPHLYLPGQIRKFADDLEHSEHSGPGEGAIQTNIEMGKATIEGWKEAVDERLDSLARIADKNTGSPQWTAIALLFNETSIVLGIRQKLSGPTIAARIRVYRKKRKSRL